MKYLTLLIITLSLMTYFPTQIRGNDCDREGLPPSNTIVEVTAGTSNNMRAEPHTDAERIALISANEAFLIMSGIECDDTYIWLEVQYNTAVGWTVAKNKTTGEVYIQLTSNNGTSAESSTTDEEPIGEIIRTSIPISANDAQLTAPIQMSLLEDTQASDIIATLTHAVDRRNTIPWHSGVPTSLYLRDSATFTINIFPAEIYNLYYPDAITELQRALETKSAADFLFDDWGVPMIIRTRTEYMEFDWGRGFREIQYYTQGLYSTPGSEYAYQLVGLTYDNRYFVMIHTDLTITPPPETQTVFRNSEWEMSDNQLESWNWYGDRDRAWLIMANYIETAPQDAFTPNLSTLNTWLASLQIPVDVLPDSAFEAPPTEYYQSNSITTANQDWASPTPYPSRCGETYQTSLQVGYLAVQMLQNDPVRVRTEPAGEYANFDILPFEYVDVIGDSECADYNGESGVWWQIENVYGQTGWVIEGLGDTQFFGKTIIQSR